MHLLILITPSPKTSLICERDKTHKSLQDPQIKGIRGWELCVNSQLVPRLHPVRVKSSFLCHTAHVQAM